jgi:L-alanine-DL-glutamate epimerase-like enolase superfamily enzyme
MVENRSVGRLQQYASEPSVIELDLPLVAAIPNGLFVEYTPSLNAVFQKPVHLEDGHFRPSQEPGLGLLWDLDSWSTTA